MKLSNIHILRKIRLQSRQLLATERAYSSENGSNTGHSCISKLLIANRGEIACRVMTTAKRLGVQTVAVYSDADRLSKHVAMADEAYRIGPAASQESYLRGDIILDVAAKAGAEAIHPGYGFLSENTEFAHLCAQKGIIFVGPPASAIRDMGIKSTSKKIMSSAGVPVIGGYHGDDQSDETLSREAEKIGFPVMIKAIRGGGGKGMRIAMTRDEFMSQLESARREAKKSFGDDAMLIEMYIDRPRHVEVQIFGDQHRNYVYLFERDCSVQRRHQKIVEEAPAPGIHKDVRQRLGEAAVRAARAVNYVGAGTVEFIMDSNQEFYFMEMNTRLQVEHPVTEMVTGTDLVEWQLMVAAGESIPLTQDQLSLKGHSFEARVYAEDPNSDFLPGAGKLNRLLMPCSQPNLRIETGVREGDEVSVHYDPMIAKIVVWGRNRQTALLKLTDALSQVNVLGLNTNVEFLMSLASHKEFKLGNVHTDFIPIHHDELFPCVAPCSKSLCQVALGVLLKENAQCIKKLAKTNDPTSPFSPSGPVRLNHYLVRTVKLSFKDEEFSVVVKYISDMSYEMEVDGNRHKVEGSLVSVDGVEKLTAVIDGERQQFQLIAWDRDVHLYSRDKSLCFQLSVPKFETKLATGISSKGALAPMPGVIEKIFVNEGQEVSPGEPLVVLIAMKMEYMIKAPSGGVVERIFCKVGDNVAKNTQLVKFKVENEENGDSSNEL